MIKLSNCRCYTDEIYKLKPIVIFFFFFLSKHIVFVFCLDVKCTPIIERAIGILATVTVPVACSNIGDPCSLPCTYQMSLQRVWWASNNLHISEAHRNEGIFFFLHQSVLLLCLQPLFCISAPSLFLSPFLSQLMDLRCS